MNYQAREKLTNLNVNLIPKHPPSWETYRWGTYTELDNPFQLKRQIIESVETKSVNLWGRELGMRELHRKRKRAPICTGGTSLVCCWVLIWACMKEKMPVSWGVSWGLSSLLVLKFLVVYSSSLFLCSYGLGIWSRNDRYVGKNNTFYLKFT